MTNLMLLKQGYLFTQIVSHERLIEANKMSYYLAKTQSSWKTENEDIFPWLIFFLNIVRSQSNQALGIIEGDSLPPDRI